MTRHEKIVHQAIAHTDRLIREASGLWYQAPRLVILNTNPEDGPSQFYMRQKLRECTVYGILCTIIDVTPETIEAHLKELAKDLRNKVIIQLPMGEGFPPLTKLISHLHPLQDVDGFGVTMAEVASLTTIEAFLMAPTFSPTTKGVLMLQKLIDPEVAGKRVNIIGKGITSGLPAILAYNQLGGTVTCTNSKTGRERTRSIMESSDIIVSCSGANMNLITKQGAEDKTLINVGMRRAGDSLAGDLSFDMYQDWAQFINPVKGSTGKLTTLNLILNCVLSQLEVDCYDK